MCVRLRVNSRNHQCGLHVCSVELVAAMDLKKEQFAQLQKGGKIMKTNRRKIHDDYIRAGALSTPINQLQVLAGSEIQSVRRRVAENERTPAETLSLLARDNSAEVRMAVAANKSTEQSIIKRLTFDRSDDVRYLLASISYIPKHQLRHLAEDSNPHVAQRAKKTLSRLESKVSRMVTVFEFLSEDHAMIASRLKRALDSFAEWSLDKRFNEAVEIMDGIRRHLERQKSLCLDLIENHSPESKALEHCLQKSIREHIRIMESLSDLIMQHVDGPDFEESLKNLLEKMRDHIEFSEDELFAEARKHLSPKELDTMNLQLNEALLLGQQV